MRTPAVEKKIQMIRPNETPQTADDLWAIAVEYDMPFLNAWKDRAKNLRLNKNAMWLSAIYEFLQIYIQSKKFKGAVLSDSEAKKVISFSKQKDALLKRIADIERRAQIMVKDQPMDMLDTTEGTEGTEATGELEGLLL
jgi:hypothetical protein